MTDSEQLPLAQRRSEDVPGHWLGRTAAQIVAADPKSYVGVDQDPDAARIVGKVVGERGHVVTADAATTGLEAETADVVNGEAMLTMHTDRGKRAIVAEAA